MAIGDVVTLTSGLVGVVGEQTDDVPLRWRVYFRENSLEVADSEISETLSAPSYSVGDEVIVWPDYGTIQAISGDEITVQATRSAPLWGDYVTWQATLVVPAWVVTRFTDTRISGTATP